MDNYHRIGKDGGKYKGKRGAGILFTDGKQILLLKRAKGGDNPGKWGLPGGGAKSEETAINNAVREVREECGLESIPGTRYDTLEQQDGRFQWTTFLFKVSRPFDVNLSHEHDDWKWIDLEKLSETDLHPKFRAELPRLLRVVRRRCGGSFTEWSRIQEILQSLLENQEAGIEIQGQ
jgi:8-oxo-dGTP diphosphatase